MIEAMIEVMMIVTIIADPTEEEVEEEEDGEPPKTGIKFTGGDHHPHITVVGATGHGLDLDLIHLVAIKA